MALVDHILGRPSSRNRKYQIVVVVAVWSVYIYKRPNGPKPIEKISRVFRGRLTTFQIVVITCMLEYARRNFARLLGLESPEPMANMYNKDFFRATWVTTALDAGFWAAMKLKPKWFRDIASMVFSVYYLVSAEAADEQVRRVRHKLNVDHLRVSWNKPLTPYLAFFTKHMRPLHLRIRKKPRRFRIHRQSTSPYHLQHIDAWLYYDGDVKELQEEHHDKIILDIPGGGFVSMNPRCHDDKLMAWAAKTGFPVVALDYGKAPEHPFPYALNECFDAYWSIIESRGRVVGLSGRTESKVVLSGDSAGGNLAVALTLMILSPSISHYPDPMKWHLPRLPLPEALVLNYPALDMNITSWLDDEQLALINDPSRRSANRGVVRRKTEDYRQMANTPLPGNVAREEYFGMARVTPGKLPSIFTNLPVTDSPVDDTDPRQGLATNRIAQASTGDSKKIEPIVPKPRPINTSLAMTSMIAFFNDRILSPEMLRAMVMLYVGENSRPDFMTEYLLSPLRAPENLLAEFPKVFMMTGERDPLVDHTCIFAGRVLQAKFNVFRDRKERGLIPEKQEFEQDDFLEAQLISGVSHGFLQFPSLYHKAWDYIEQCSRWMKEAFAEADEREKRNDTPLFSRSRVRRPSQGAESSDGEDRPLEMSSLSFTSLPQDKPKGKAPDDGRRNSSGRGSIRKPTFSGRKSPVLVRRNPSLQRLTINEELMPRRMLGLTGGLMGGDGNAETP